METVKIAKDQVKWEYFALILLLYPVVKLFDLLFHGAILRKPYKQVDSHENTEVDENACGAVRHPAQVPGHGEGYETAYSRRRKVYSPLAVTAKTFPADAYIR